MRYVIANFWPSMDSGFRRRPRPVMAKRRPTVAPASTATPAPEPLRKAA